MYTIKYLFEYNNTPLSVCNAHEHWYLLLGLFTHLIYIQPYLYAKQTLHLSDSMLFCFYLNRYEDAYNVLVLKY